MEHLILDVHQFLIDPPFCKEEQAYDNKVWPKTNVGNIAELPCPSPLIGKRYF